MSEATNSAGTVWNFDLSSIPKDGRQVLVLESWDYTGTIEFTSATVRWQVDEDGTVFGWTYDGGDRFDPIAWSPITDPEGNPIYP